MAATRSKDDELQFKVLLIGESGVGKTSLILRFADGSFSSTRVTSIGSDFKLKTIQVEGMRIALQIWDTAGQERFRTITSSYYRGTLAYLIVYDVTDLQTFKSLPHWLGEIERYGSNDATKLIVANKCDLSDKTEVSSTEGKSFAEEMGLGFIETSAKTGMNVDDAFTAIVAEVVKRQQKLNPKYRANYINITNNNNPNPNHGIFSWVKNIFGSNDPLRGPPSQNPNFKEVNPNQNPSNHNRDSNNNVHNNVHNNVNNNSHNNQNNQNRENNNNTRVSDQTNSTSDGSTNDLDENDKTKSGPSDSKQEPKKIVSINL
jgi:small GTP-binding protein